MTFTTAKDEIAERSHDTSAAHKTRCGDWLNVTMQEMCSFSQSWDWLQESANLSIVAGTQEYTISSAIGSDVDAIYDIRVESDGGWKFLTYGVSEFDALYPDPDLESGRPEGFTIWDGVLILDRDPDANYTAKVKYHKTVSDLSADGDLPPWPSRWDYVWLNGAMRYAYQFNDDARAGAAEVTFQRQLRSMFALQGRMRPMIVVGGGRRLRSRWPGSPYPVHRFGY